jgi:membrane dipeptidase
MTDIRTQASAIVAQSLVIDTLGGAIVHPTPHVDEGTYEEQVLGYGWTAMNACLVSEPSYNATWEEVLAAMYENFLYFEMSPKVRHVETVDDLLEAKRQGQLGVFFGLQSGSCLEQDRKRVRLLHKLGLRVLQLTYMERNFIGDGCLEPENRGLTHYGIQVVRDCNRVGMLVDCSHVGHQTTLDAAHHSSKPIVVSHTAVRAIADNPRCVTDEQMIAVARKGGTIGITPYAPFIRTDRTPTLEDFIDHFDYAIKLIGEDHVTVATDMFDGKTKVNWPTPWYYPEITKGAQYSTRRVPGFSKKSHLIDLVEGFLRRGYTPGVVEKLLGANFLRVLREVWK